MDFFGDDSLITSENISQYSYNYFVVTTNRMWSFEEYKKYIKEGKDIRRVIKGTKTVNTHFYVDKNAEVYKKLYKASEDMRKILRKYS